MRLIFMLALLLLAFPVPCLAQSGDNLLEQQFAEQLEASGAQELVDGLDGDTRALLEDYHLDEISPQSVLEMDSSQLLSLLVQVAQDQVRRPLKLLGTLLAVTVLGALAAAFQPASDKAMARLYENITVLAAAAVSVSSVLEVVRQTAVTVQDGAYFMVSFVPVFAGILTASGQAVSAGAYHVAVFALCQIIAQTAVSVLIPLLDCYLAFSVVAGFSSSLSFGKAAQLIRKGTVFLFTLLLTTLIGLLSLQGLVAGQVDQAVSKTAKYLVSSLVPVVGSAVSDALATVKSCLSLLKSCVGAFGIFAVFAAFLPDLVGCLLWMGTMQVAVFAAGVLGMDKLSKLYEAMASVLTILFSILLSVMLLFIITAAVMMILGGRVS